MSVNPTQLEHVMAFRGAYGRLCTLAAQAMKQGNASREAVRYALAGEGDHLGLTKVREARDCSNEAFGQAIKALTSLGVENRVALAMCRDFAGEARTAVESEWGHSQAAGDEPAPWDHLSLPMVQVRG